MHDLNDYLTEIENRSEYDIDWDYQGTTFLTEDDEVFLDRKQRTEDIRKELER